MLLLDRDLLTSTVLLGAAEPDEQPDAVAGDEPPLVQRGLVLQAAVVLLRVVQHLRRNHGKCEKDL